MSNHLALGRRNFIKSAGMTALAGATASTLPNTAAAQDGTPLHTSLNNGRYDFDKVYNRVGSNCSRWDRHAARYKPGQFKYGMGVATMDFEVAPCITEALSERIQHHAYGYMASTDSLRDAIIDWNGTRHNLDIDPEALVISNGVYPGIIAALRAFAPKGTKVLMVTPIYEGFPYHCRHTQVIQSESKMLYRNGRYEIDWADLEAKMTPDTHAMILCNPQNPTGNVWSEDDLMRIGRLCLENQIVVLSDEIHSDIVRPGSKYVPFASLSDRAVVENSITFNALSKTFNLAGMKNAYMNVPNATLRGRLEAHHRADLNTLGVVANEAAYRGGADWFDQVLPYIDNNHKILEHYAANRLPGVSLTKAEGTYMAWLDFTPVMEAIGAAEMAKVKGSESPEYYFQDWLVENAGVFLNPGSVYSTGGEGHMRINLASSRLVVEEALESLDATLRKV